MSAPPKLDPTTDTTTCKRCRRTVRLVVTTDGVCSTVPMARSCVPPGRARKAVEREKAEADSSPESDR